MALRPACFPVALAARVRSIGASGCRKLPHDLQVCPTNVARVRSPSLIGGRRLDAHLRRQGIWNSFDAARPVASSCV